MSETSSIRSSQRASAFLNRPHIAPMGPRTRQSSLRTQSLLSVTTQSPAVTPSVNTLNLPEFGGRTSPEVMSPASSLATRKSLPPLTEEPPSPASVLSNDRPSILIRGSMSMSSSRIEEDGEEDDQHFSLPEFPPSGPPTATPSNTFFTSQGPISEAPYEQPVDPDSEYAIPESPPPAFEASLHAEPYRQPLSLDAELFTHEQEPSVREPSIQEPTTNDSASIHESTHRESSVRDSLNPTPSIREPSIRESLIQAPSIREPSIHEQPTYEASIRDPSMPEPSLYEPSIRERSLRESVISTKSSNESPPSVPHVPPSPAPSKASFNISSVAKINPPPAIKFDSTPVSWKGLPMEAAVWTVDSGELQGIVSRAIRASASESFVRLLTAENLDKVLPAELERLEHLKAVTQSKYRFLVHRRTMLFQALNSTSLGQQKDGEDGVSVVSRLASQLADTIAECDQKLEEVLQITDQVAQINKLIDVHWSSALAIALRKLNGSFARRNADLATAKERITQLEAELAEAWKEAERMARELDDYEAAIAADDDDAVIETAEIVSVPKPTHTRRASTPMTPTLVEFTPKSMSPSASANNDLSTSPKSPVIPRSPVASTSAAPRSPNPAQHQFNFPHSPTTAGPIIHLKAKESQVEPDVPDTVSLRSTRSTRSARSARSARSTKSNRSGWTSESNHVSAVNAAKTRSRRMSQSSLRIAINPTGADAGAGPSSGHSRKHSTGKTPRTTPFEEHPPVPELPAQYSSFNGIASANVSSTLLYTPDGSTPPRPTHHHMSSLSMSMSLLHPSPRLRRRASLDSVMTGGGRSIMTNPGSVAYKGKAAASDDLYLRPKQPLVGYDYYHNRDAGAGGATMMMMEGESEMQMMMASRTPRANTFGYASSSGGGGGMGAGQNSTLLAYYDHDHDYDDGSEADMYTAPRPPPKDPSKTIPSMWMNADAAGHGHAHKPSLSTAPPTSYVYGQKQQQTPSQHGSFTSSAKSPTVSNSSESHGAQDPEHSTSKLIQRSSSSNVKTTAYNKLRGLTKRYSVSLPLFNSHARATPRKSA
ncbi:hypothetical protein D9613_007126 [Agrocybe pediades]|uniref:Uncharacterized protein n=1 Tax=Agrocybe pediades TaxID=84607 RepID=A0A8H4QHZ0_9AGAR|nr:hypothetical protein D9613_007126 [Agrocybe pediades]